MKKIQIEKSYSVSEQINCDDIKSLADDGIKTIICHRPDGEETNQISSAELKSAAAENGIKFIQIPVSGLNIPQHILQEFISLIDQNDDKIHAYCRTGMRASVFWALSQARSLSSNDILTKAHALGINLTPIIEQLDHVNQSSSSQ